MTDPSATADRLSSPLFIIKAVSQYKKQLYWHPAQQRKLQSRTKKDFMESHLSCFSRILESILHIPFESHLFGQKELLKILQCSIFFLQ